MLTPSTIDKLTKLLGLIGSDHDGEALSAARKAHRLIVENGLQWRDIIVSPTAIATGPEKVVLAPHHAIAQQLLDGRKGTITDFERRFLLGILAFQNLSSKQQSTLDKIALKVTASKRR